MNDLRMWWVAFSAKAVGDPYSFQAKPFHILLPIAGKSTLDIIEM
jgi:hypothetical protein